MKYEAIEKFFRQLVKDPARQVLIKKHFELSSLFITQLIFHPEEIYQTAVALETESLRKIDMDYENKVKIADGEPDVDIKNHVLGTNPDGSLPG